MNYSFWILGLVYISQIEIFVLGASEELVQIPNGLASL
ncbi:hypothetical protein TCAL_16333 [Tigriopus californicus]|uniref:Uncharacterized protein n=1 Tax=Tigriopus californicus TaxID=6832 RepID=A0A553N735_TIGCA|nr:hypothetical protein TCAL_16333 [Tigriopus californicus]